MSEGWRQSRFLWGRTARKDADLTPAAKLIAWALCEEFVDGDTGTCRLCIDTIAEAVGYGKRQVQNAIRELELGGYLAVSRATGRGKASAYALRMPGQAGATIIPLKGRGEAAAGTRKGAAECTHSRAERVHSRSGKGAAQCTPYSYPSIDPKARTREAAAPGGVLIDAEKDDHILRRWDAWLASKGWGGWASFDLSRRYQAGRLVVLVPQTLPPDEGETVAEARALTFFRARSPAKAPASHGPNAGTWGMGGDRRGECSARAGGVL